MKQKTFFSSAFKTINRNFTGFELRSLACAILSHYKKIRILKHELLVHSLETLTDIQALH